MTDDRKNIVLNTDSQYVVHCCTMLSSLFENNINSKFNIHVISGGLTGPFINDIRNLVEEKYSQKLYLYIIDSEKLNYFPKYTNSHISQAANYRLFVDKILPSDIDKVLYLDCDLIVTKSLAPLWHIDISDCPIGAVEDMWSGKDDNYIRLGYDKKYGYFNSGVLLINLKWWRENNICDKFIEYLKCHDNLKFVDQDILNGMFYSSRKLIPFKWNVQDGFLRRKPKIRKSCIPTLQNEIKSPAIIHYTGSRKPWDYDCINPYKESYFKYLDMTKWKHTRPYMPLKFKFKLMLDKVLYFLYLKPRKYIKISK